MSFSLCSLVYRVNIYSLYHAQELPKASEHKLRQAWHVQWAHKCIKAWQMNMQLAKKGWIILANRKSFAVVSPKQPAWGSITGLFPFRCHRFESPWLLSAASPKGQMSGCHHLMCSCIIHSMHWSYAATFRLHSNWTVLCPPVDIDPQWGGWRKTIPA